MKTFFTIFCLVVSFTAFSQTIRYVNSKATGANDGTSWTNAFVKLQDALAAATSGDQLWVAAGTYYPDEGAAQTNDDRHASFTLKNNVAIYGGFVGTETQLSQRNWQTNATILSGDLQQNDGENFANNGDNSFHVITGESTDNTTLLDGLTITGGNANMGDYYNDGGGGGIQFDVTNPGSVAIINCSFVKNKAIYGGGICNNAATLNVAHCSFSENRADEGGAMWILGSLSTFTDCSFSKDTATYGGAVNCQLFTSTLMNCSFSENWAYYGGGVFISGGKPNIITCTFSKNSALAGEGGGAICNQDFASSMLTNCTFSENIAQNGGAIFNRTAEITANGCSFQDNKVGTKGGGIYGDAGASSWFTNCIFSGNSGPLGGVVYGTSMNTTLTNCSVSGNTASATAIFHTDQYAGLTVTNSILWGNTGSLILNASGGTAAVSYSIVQGGYSGNSVLDQDPLFADAANGNLHLQPCSPSIDAGDDASNNTEKDLDSNARKIDAINGGNQIDMGAYEFQTPLDADNDGHTICNGDCDDNNPNVWHTGTFYKDADGDGYTTGDGESVCYGNDTPAGYSATKSDFEDCDDNKVSVHPGAKEICGDGIDNNCNGEIDENCSVACAQTATNTNTTNITSSSARLNWSAPADPSRWVIQFKKVGDATWTSISVRGSLRATTISSLDAKQKYVWHIRAKCDGGIITVFSPRVTFKTLAAHFADKTNAEQFLVANNIRENAAALNLYPNPTSGQFIIQLHLPDNITANAQVELMNITGQTVLQENANISNGSLYKSIIIPSSLSSGIYMVTVVVNDKTYHAKLVYQK